MYFINVLLFCIVLIKGDDVNVTNTSFIADCRNASTYVIPSGYKPHPTIIGGYVASIKEFPYAVRLYVRQSRKLGYCSGQMVTLRLVITAAHCVLFAHDIVVVGGMADQTDYARGINREAYARYRVKEIFVHPQFDRNRYRHDVAILKTGRAMLHRGYGFVKVSYEKLNQTVNSKIYGWGETENHVKNHVLYGKQLSAVNCSAAINSVKCHEYICLKEKGICHGDSGGGLLVDGVLRGIASFYSEKPREECSKEEFHYYYASLAEEQDFVKDCIDKNGSNYNRFFFHFIWVFLFLHSIIQTF